MALIAALIRHGDYHQLPGAPSAHQPFPLNEAGERHARESATDIQSMLDRLNLKLCPVIDSSQMLRGWQTARIIADNLAIPGLEVHAFDALAERSVGCAANLSVETIESVVHEDPRFPDPPSGWKSDSHYRLPLQGAESLLDAGERVADHVTERMWELGSDTARETLKLFVGHGAAFRHAAYQMSVLEFEQLAKLSMFHGRPVYMEYSPGRPWRHIGGEWKIRKPEEVFTD